jgi:oligopeptide/dipeptide ABC transporter ATP-binding protein
VCASAREARDRVAELLEKVGLQPEMADAHPHAFSGGQRQRIGIARALGLEPGLLICDEAVSALDVSVQAQILNLFNRLKHDLSLTYLFISHDLAVIRHVADRVAVMYLGQVVEIAPADELFSAPAHPYTRALVASKPAVRGTGPIRRVALRGEIPSPINPPSGCRFHTRCPDARSSCREEAPLLKRIGPDRLARCHLVEDMTSARVDPVSRIDPLAHAQSGGPPPC